MTLTGSRSKLSFQRLLFYPDLFMRALILLQLILTLSMSAVAQHQFRLKIQDGSQIKIHGSSNIHEFTLTQTASSFPERLIQITQGNTSGKILVNNGTISIPVRHFTTPVKLIQFAFYKMMMADQHPNLVIRLKQLDALQPYKGKIRSTAQVDVSIAGVTRTYIIPVESKKVNESVEITGTKRMSIRDFGITPPSPMMGMVRVSEWVDIQMNLNCLLEQKTEKSLARQ